MPLFKVGDRVSLKVDQHEPPKVFTVKSIDPGGKYVITDANGVDSNHQESELEKAPPAKTP